MRIVACSVTRWLDYFRHQRYTTRIQSSPKFYITYILLVKAKFLKLHFPCFEHSNWLENFEQPIRVFQNSVSTPIGLYCLMEVR